MALMLHKAFQVFLIVFVVILTLAGVLVVLPALLFAFMPLHTNGIVAVPGGISLLILKVIVPVVLALLIALVCVISRPKLR